MSRDNRLDVWRGLCLIDVVLVHLAYSNLGFPGLLDALVKYYARYAAGGFVFLAGLTVAAVFAAKVRQSAETRRSVYERLWRRAGLLVVVDTAASIVYRLLDLVRLYPGDLDTTLGDALVGAVLLQRPGLTGGILLLYAVMLAAMPAVFEVWRRWGGAPIAAASILLYALALATGGRLAWPPFHFPVLYWQPLFLAGFLSLPAYRWLQAGGLGRRVGWAAAASAAFAVIFLSEHGPALGIQAFATLLPLDFTKTPLQAGALLWYLSLVQVVMAWSSLLWDRVPGAARWLRWVPLLGRHSLVVYVAHVFTEIPVLEYVWRIWPAVTVRLSLAAADIFSLVLICAAIERQVFSRAFAGAGRLARALAPRALRPAPALAPVAAAVMLALVLRPGTGLEPLPAALSPPLELELPLFDAGGELTGVRPAADGVRSVEDAKDAEDDEAGAPLDRPAETPEPYLLWPNVSDGSPDPA
jgi:hypothetical protein